MITKVVRDRKIQPLTSVKDFQDLAVQVRRAGGLRPDAARSAGFVDPVQEREVIAIGRRLDAARELGGGRIVESSK